MTIKATPSIGGRALFLLALVLLVLAVSAFCPSIDLAISGLFYESGRGFFLEDAPPFVLLHWLATLGAWLLASALLAAVVVTYVRRRTVLGLDAKSWLFLFLGLLLAPGLIGNIGLKDHWGRARPRQTIQFGGTETFSPALEPQKVLHKNGSFIAGDAAFGFYLPSFAYVTRRRRSRVVFAAGITAGALFGFARIVMGSHFLSDVLYAAAIMLAATAALHATFYGRKATASYWRYWLTGTESEGKA
ncbi:MAG: phosphatase PAP2 family protein [Pseudomonadota bacterium]|nr:phosphatase PAP2 family protein [Pseudomonadota bacterium]